MIPNLLFYKLLLVALVLICFMIHVWWPDDPSAASKTPLKPDKPRRKRTKEPKPLLASSTNLLATCVSKA